VLVKKGCAESCHSAQEPTLWELRGKGGGSKELSVIGRFASALRVPRIVALFSKAVEEWP
jgi:hypothetical protein